MLEVGTGEITPEMQVRLDKYGSTLDKNNLETVIERIADYPEIISAVENLEIGPKTFARVGLRVHMYLGGYNGRGRPAVAMCDAVTVIPTDEAVLDQLPWCLDCQYAMISYEDHLITEAHTRASQMLRELHDAGFPQFKDY